MRLYLTTLAAAAVAVGSSFVLDTSSMTGSSSWNHANGSHATASLRYLSTTSQEWRDVFASIQSSLDRFYYEDPPGTPQSYLYPTNLSNGGDLPGVLTANHFGVADYGLWSGTPVVGLEWNFSADSILQSAIPNHSTPLSPIPSSYNMYEGGHMLFDTMDLNPGFDFSLIMEHPFKDIQYISGNYGWVIVPPGNTLPNTYQNQRYLLFGSMDLSDPDPANHTFTLYDGVAMTLNAHIRPTGAVPPVPEPFTMVLGVGALAVATVRKRMKSNR